MTPSSRSFIPTPLEIAILLTFLVLFLASLFTSHSLSENLVYWGDGLWSLLTFMTQMCLILLGGFVVAASKPVNKLLQIVARIPKEPFQVYIFTFLVSAVACWINWGLGLVVGAFFAREVARQNTEVHFPLVVAASYMGFLFWHGGLSGSIPLVVSTPDNFSAKWLGVLIHFDQTVFSGFNIFLILVLLISLCSLIFYFESSLRNSKKTVSFQEKGTELAETYDGEEATFFSVGAYSLLVILMLAYLGGQIASRQFHIGLNQINFLLILFGLIFHGGISRYMGAVKQACQRLAPILVQYPLYAGIMGIMIESGLAIQISDAFVAVSNRTTYPLFMFLSAGLVNLFVPSGGGQWAVQAPVVIQGAKELGVPLWKVVMAVAWGDAWTNLAQPFWALPLLSIVGLGIKDIMRYCLSALVVSGVVISVFFVAL